MSVIERVLVRFAGPEDLEWCVVSDDHVTEQVIRRKIVNDEIIIAELDGQPVAYLRLEYLWSNIPYIGVIWVVELYRKEGIGRRILNFLCCPNILNFSKYFPNPPTAKSTKNN